MAVRRRVDFVAEWTLGVKPDYLRGSLRGRIPVEIMKEVEAQHREIVPLVLSLRRSPDPFCHKPVCREKAGVT